MTISPDTWLRDLQSQSQNILARLTMIYGRFLPVLRQHVNNLTEDIQVHLERDGTVDVVRLQSYQDLLRAVEQDVATFGQLSLDVTRSVGQDNILLGEQAALDLVLSNSDHIDPQIILSAWRRPSPSAIKRVLDIVGSDAMQRSFSSFSSVISQRMSDLIIASVIAGRNPRVLASNLNDMLGMPLLWADNIARTTSLYAYRLAAHDTYSANPDIVEGWMWYCTLDNNVCLSCLEQHGTIHSANEYLNDHHRGRCTPVPIVVGATWMDGIQSGKDWFDDLPQEDQLTIMRPSVYRAYQDNAVDFGMFGGEYHNDIFGTMRHELPLVAMIGVDSAEQYYQ